MYDNNKLTVADAAMQAGFPNDGLFPKRGKALEFTVNGKARMARGEFGEAAVITVNGNAADINTPVHANDIIAVSRSTAGRKASCTISQLPEAGDNISVIVNGQKIAMPKFASVNGLLQSGYYEIQENDSVEMLNFYTVKQITEFMDVNLMPDMNIYVNNELADMDTPVYDNFSVVWASSQKEPEIRQEAPEQKPEVHNIVVLVNKAPVTLSGKAEYIFVDVFDRIDFDLSRPRGKGIVTTLNGRPAQYMEPIHDGDVIEIYWQE